MVVFGKYLHFQNKTGLNDYFILAGILTLQASSSFDYEQRDVYTFTFAVKDQYLEGLEKKVLVLNITNINEAPTITIIEEYITFNENTVTSMYIGII